MEDATRPSGQTKPTHPMEAATSCFSYAIRAVASSLKEQLAVDADLLELRDILDSSKVLKEFENDLELGLPEKFNYNNYSVDELAIIGYIWGAAAWP
ncbi:hypothetical protein N0V88_006156 [Collariella sp. IMI 366227]|nr:hypothetical protein N0V88_006156 [Collariella sp. IMI 366227]